MASDLPYLWRDVYDRINTDTGSGGFLYSASPLITAVYNTRGPVNADSGTTGFPYIVYSTFNGENQSDFRTRVWFRQVRFDIYLETEANSTIDPLARGAAIMRRLEGNWEDKTAGTAPDYGFDRWKPTLTSSGWTADIFNLIESEDDHDEDMYHWYMTFNIRTSKVGA